MGAEKAHDLQALTSANAGNEGLDPEFNSALVKSIALLGGRALMLAGDGPLSEDFVQATFERALRAAHRPPVKEVQPWLARILKNVAIDHWRSAAVRRSCQLDPDCTPAPLPVEEPAWWREVTAVDLERAAQKLPQTFRRLFLLRLEGRTNNQIARRLGLTATTVATRFFRGRSLMQRALASSYQPYRQEDLAPSCRGGPFVRSSPAGGRNGQRHTGPDGHHRRGLPDRAAGW